MCLNGPPIEFFRICLPPRGKCLKKELPLAEWNVSLSQLSTIWPECREKTHAVWRTLCPTPSHGPRKERLRSSPMGTQRTMMMCLIPHHGLPPRQSRMAKWNGARIRHAATMARPNGQRTQWTPKTARASTPRPKSPIARPVPDTPHLPIPQGERKNVHEPLEAHHVVLRPTQNEKAGRALVGGKIRTRLVLQIAVRLKTTMTFMTDPNIP